MKERFYWAGALYQKTIQNISVRSAEKKIYYTIDDFMKRFCDDSAKVLKEYDQQIHNNIITAKHRDFYLNSVKGISLYSVTEPILKFLIYTNLCNKYQMWPEVTFYNDKKLLDLAIFFRELSVEEIEDEEKDWDPEIAVEMKWTGIKKNGEFYTNAINRMRDDIIYFSGDIKCHYLIADASGKSVLVEYWDEDIKAITVPENYQIASNFIAYNGLNIGEGWDEFDRYNTVKERIEKNNGILTESQAVELLAEIGCYGDSGEDRLQWTVLYNITTLNGKIFTNRNKDNIIRFQLD